MTPDVVTFVAVASFTSVDSIFGDIGQVITMNDELISKHNIIGQQLSSKKS